MLRSVLCIVVLCGVVLCAHCCIMMRCCEARCAELMCVMLGSGVVSFLRCVGNDVMRNDVICCDTMRRVG